MLIGTDGALDSAAPAAPQTGVIRLRAISIRSATTAEAVGPAPAPRPSSITRPTKSPSATTALNTPSTRAIGAVCGTMQGCTRASIPASVCRAMPSSLMR